jgi:hypothetical protein
MPDEFIVTEDGVELKHGDRAYDYYSMKPGTIGKIDAVLDGDSNDRNQMPWFDFNHDDGTRTTLNGQRICSVEYARERGFKDA